MWYRGTCAHKLLEVGSGKWEVADFQGWVQEDLWRISKTWPQPWRFRLAVGLWFTNSCRGAIYWQILKDDPCKQPGNPDFWSIRVCWSRVDIAQNFLKTWIVEKSHFFLSTFHGHRPGQAPRYPGPDQILQPTGLLSLLHRYLDPSHGSRSRVLRCFLWWCELAVFPPGSWPVKWTNTNTAKQKEVDLSRMLAPSRYKWVKWD